MRPSAWITRNLVYPAALVATGQTELHRRLEILTRQQWQGPEQLHGYRTARMRHLLSRALRDVPFYRKCHPDLTSRDIHLMPSDEVWQLHRSFPVVSKRMIQRDPDAFRAQRTVGRVGSKTTGGSTGEPVTISKPASALAQERAAMWLAYDWFHVHIGDRCLRFWGVPQNRRRRALARMADMAMNRTTLSAFAFQEEDLRRYWDELRRLRPDYIHGYVSLIDEFARIGIEEELCGDVPPVTSVILTAEAVSDPQRRRIELAFGAPTQIEYGCGEVGPIAHECPSGGLHVMAPNVEVEILSDSGKPSPQGRVVVTDLHNLAMPLIRYDLGDYAGWGSSCSCGRGLPVLEHVYGRAYHTIQDARGTRFHGEYFMYLFEDLQSAGSSVAQFQVAQRSASRLRVRIVCPEGRWSEERERIERKLFRALPQFDVTIERASSIDRLPSGKMQVIDNLVAAGDEA